jgi:hypothetical protein
LGAPFFFAGGGATFFEVATIRRLFGSLDHLAEDAMDVLVHVEWLARRL